MNVDRDHDLPVEGEALASRARQAADAITPAFSESLHARIMHAVGQSPAKPRASLRLDHRTISPAVAWRAIAAVAMLAALPTFWTNLTAWNQPAPLAPASFTHDEPDKTDPLATPIHHTPAHGFDAVPQRKRPFTVSPAVYQAMQDFLSGGRGIVSDAGPAVAPNDGLLLMASDVRPLELTSGAGSILVKRMIERQSRQILARGFFRGADSVVDAGRRFMDRLAALPSLRGQPAGEPDSRP